MKNEIDNSLPKLVDKLSSLHTNYTLHIKLLDDFAESSDIHSQTAKSMLNLLKEEIQPIFNQVIKLKTSSTMEDEVYLKQLDQLVTGIAKLMQLADLVQLHDEAWNEYYKLTTGLESKEVKSICSLKAQLTALCRDIVNTNARLRTEVDTFLRSKHEQCDDEMSSCRSSQSESGQNQDKTILKFLAALRTAALYNECVKNSAPVESVSQLRRYEECHGAQLEIVRNLSPIMVDKPSLINLLVSKDATTAPTIPLDRSRTSILEETYPRSSSLLSSNCTFSTSANILNRLPAIKEKPTVQSSSPPSTLPRSRKSSWCSRRSLISEKYDSSSSTTMSIGPPTSSLSLTRPTMSENQAVVTNGNDDAGSNADLIVDSSVPPVTMKQLQTILNRISNSESTKSISSSSSNNPAQKPVDAKYNQGSSYRSLSNSPSLLQKCVDAKSESGSSYHSSSGSSLRTSSI